MTNSTDIQQRETIARAIQEADDSFGYTMNLVRLVDEVSTYRFTISGEEPFETEDRDEGYERIAFARNKRRADAILALRSNPQPGSEGADERVVQEMEYANSMRNMAAAFHAAMIEACDLLAERTYGNPARSPGHNARLCLESALAASPTPPTAQPGEVERLRSALEPFAARIVDVGETETDEDTFSNSRTPYNRSPVVTVGDIRRARAVLNGEP